MSWLIDFDGCDPIRVHEHRDIRLVTTAMLMARGVNVKLAETFGKTVLDTIVAAEKARMFDRSKTVEASAVAPDGKLVRVLPGDPPEDPTRQCDGYDSWGDRCGRYMNHRGDCDSGRH